MGASLKDLGNKVFAFSKIDLDNNDIIFSNFINSLIV
jgi:hypothetical protein